jgi:NNP family nitrate/nitrite transporter-like MFS transporter
MAGCLILGAIPSALAGTATNAKGLFVIRFFVGILGGSFVPCQVWCTGFFDKNCVGRANALAGGWGNAGGGITYFVMPAVFDSLVRRGLTPHVAWRVSFVTIPFVMLMTMAITILLFAPDTPTGPWKDRHLNRTIEEVESPEGSTAVVDVAEYDMEDGSPAKRDSKLEIDDIEKKKQHLDHPTQRGHEASYDATDVNFAAAGLIKTPSIGLIFRVLWSFPTIMLCVMYFVTFGAELAINSNLSSFYIQSSGKPAWAQTFAANWAAMYGLLNVVTRPLGGYIGDLLYPVLGVEGKKFWVITCGLVQGIVLITIGFVPHINVHALIAAVAVSAIFTDAGNGANFAVVPHVHPANNGIVAGLAGAFGNLGGVIFALVFRFNGTNYHRSYWIIGIMSVSMSLAVSWVRIPKLPGELGWLGKPRPGHL